MSQADFRQVLKDQTHADHERVDRLISTHDLSTHAGFAAFLLVHHRCFRVLAEIVPDQGPAARDLGDMLRTIDADLSSLGVSSAKAMESDLEGLDALAIDYVIEGSRLGTKVLKRRWMQATDPVVRGASAYFSRASAPSRWREVCAELSSVPVGSDRADHIIEDTKLLFGLFYDAAITSSVNHNRAVEYSS